MHKPPFEEVFMTYHDRILNHIYWQVGDLEDARDLTQQVFLQAYRAYDRFRGDARVSTWLYRIATNTVRSFFRSRKRRRPPDSLEALEDAAGPVAVTYPSGPQMPRHWLNALRRALAELPEAFRQTVVLFYFEGYSIEEIAEILQVRPGTVKSRLNRARLLLRDALMPLMGEELGS
jgi:RNA polymerase sigma-70 factor (ECF subfamily)